LPIDGASEQEPQSRRAQQSRTGVVAHQVHEVVGHVASIIGTRILGPRRQRVAGAMRRARDPVTAGMHGVRGSVQTASG